MIRGGKCVICKGHGAVEDRQTGKWYCWSDARKRGMLTAKHEAGDTFRPTKGGAK